jgi:predicted AAA+ superfamily ATPase
MKMIKRFIEEALQAHLKRKEITLLIGPRQVGKTTLMRSLQQKLEGRGGKTLFFNLDIEEDGNLFESQQRFLSAIELEVGKSEAVIFIDEIQRKENAGLFLKGLYDRELPYKFLVSGSGSLELKEKVVESLAGRKRVFEIAPVSFAEFLNHKMDYRYEGRLVEYCRLYPERARALMEEYLIFGGYPDVVTTNGKEEKIAVLEEIYRSYIDKDINNLISIDKPRAFEILLRLLALNIGYPLNYSNLAKKTALSIPTVQKYIWYLEKTFIIKLIPPFFSNPAKELVKAPVVYFNDLGMRSLLRRSFHLDPLSTDTAFSFQNLVYQLLVEQSALGLREVKYWRTKDKAEVDFILDQHPLPVPVEVKYSDSPKVATASRSMQSFLRSYKPEQAFIVTLAPEGRRKAGDTRLVHLPYFEWLRDPLEDEKNH